MLAMAAAGLIQSQEIVHSTPPGVIRKADPEYTEEARAAKLQGTAVLSTVIGIDGVASEIKVNRGLGMGLDEKAVECLKRWLFKPATLHGEPVPAKVTIEMNFRLPS